MERFDDQSVTPTDEEAERIAAIVLARIDQRIEHLHMPMAVPDAQEAAALKANAPEVYAMWLDLVRQRAADDSHVQRAGVNHPLELAKRGQWFGMVALLSLLAFAAWLAHFPGATRWLAGIIAVFNIVAIIGVFMSRPGGPNNP